MLTPEKSTLFDAIVVGTGFAGAVTACRLVEAGFKICVLERGRRYGPEDFPKYPTEDLFAQDDKDKQNFAPPPDFSRWLWSADHGIYDIRDLKDTLSVQAAGYGGGSLIYANVHLRPPRALFERGWPEAYTRGRLDRYFDLAAYMLRVSPIPTRLAKTLQLQRAADTLHGSADDHWFRTPLAVNFTGTNAFGREQQPCDMRGRCWRGCDRQAKNTLDLNYLARAEDGHVKPDIRTLAEVTRIDRNEHDGIFTVTYNDLLFRADDESKKKEMSDRARPSVRAKHVFLCAGSLNTTELLLENSHLWNQQERKIELIAPLGSHYFPNTDSFSVVFDCDEPHEADYGPTITSALLFQNTAAEGSFSQSLDFEQGCLANDNKELPAAGVKVRGKSSGATATLSHDPILDWGCWKHGAVGALVLAEVKGEFEATESVDIGEHATAVLRSAIIRHEHWFLVEDGGYPPDLEPLVGVFRSPLWLRRNRYLEPSAGTPKPVVREPTTRTPQPMAPLRRPPTERLRLQALGDALGGTAKRAASSDGFLGRASDQSGFRAVNLLEDQVNALFPDWFVTALENDRKELFEHAAAFALPLLGRLLGGLSTSVAKQIDPETLSKLGGGNVDGKQLEVLIRGMLRQGLQIIAGSEAAVATNATRLFFERVPGTPEQLLRAIGDLLLWALAYGTNDGHTGILLTMGRDLYRGRLALTSGGGNGKTGRLEARLPSRLLDTASMTQERVLRDIASHGWHGELRTNPAWTTLNKRVTVHSQGGCPMGEPCKSVTNPEGEVHGCEGLYVMDAAAFPTSVGVNPSATIAAVAEFKIERFIRKTQQNWTTADMRDARVWVDQQGRAALDPLNHGNLGKSNEPSSGVLELRFKEEMRGVFADVDKPTDWSDLAKFPGLVPTFTDAEDRGSRDGWTITTELDATVGDLAQLISPELTIEPLKIAVTGRVTLGKPPSESRTYVLTRDSFLQMFVKPSDDSKPTRFFRYKLLGLDSDSHKCQIDALKVLRDAPGFDVWHDSSSLYFEISDGSEVSGRSKVQRGVLRVSIETFLRKQLKSMEITGTKDDARKIWALAAFYKYFAGELCTVYMKRADKLTELLRNLLMGIHV